MNHDELQDQDDSKQNSRRAIKTGLRAGNDAAAVWYAFSGRAARKFAPII
jgi:hypothetical protein